jgi:adenylate cyclase
MIRPPLGRYIRYWYTYRTAVAVVIALLLSAAIYGLYTQQIACDTHVGGCFINISPHPEDRLLAAQNDPGPGVVIVGIDDRSAQVLGHYPFTRERYAAVLRTLEQDGALVVGFDVNFTDEGDPTKDAVFATTLAESSIPVVLSYPGSGTSISTGKVVQLNPKTTPAGVDEIPLKKFWCKDTNADSKTPCQAPDPNVLLGSTDLVLDADGVVRRIPLFVQPACFPTGACSTPVIDSFAFATYRASTPGFQTVPDLQESDNQAVFGSAWSEQVDGTGSALINFSGPPGNFESFKHYVSFADVIGGTAPPSMFKNSIVLVGAYNLSGVNDQQLVSTSAGSNGTLPMAGVEIQANIIQMFGPPTKFLVPEPSLVVLVIIAILAILTAVGVARVSVLWGLLGTGLALAAFTFATAFVANNNSFIPDLFHPWLAVGLTYSGVTAYRFLYEDREKRKVTELFGHYLKPEIVAELAKTRFGVEDILRGGERRDMSLLFVDIRGFTSMSESMAADDVVQVAQMYLDHLSGIIFTWDGTIDKYVGDEIVAFWNAPRLQPNHALLAIRCAYDLINRAPELEERLIAKGLPPIRWGIGINTGPAVVGNIGARKRIQYTALGDTVNTAARFCSHAPAFHVLIGQQTYEQCKDYIAVDLVPGVQLKGKSAQTFQIYQVTAIRQTPDSPWVQFPTEMATQAHIYFTSQYTQQPVIAAAESGSNEILVGEAAEERLAQPESPPG